MSSTLALSHIWTAVAAVADTERCFCHGPHSCQPVCLQRYQL